MSSSQQNDLTATGFRSLWEAGIDDPSKQSASLETLNAKLDVDVLCFCSASVWSYGGKDVKHEVQVNVNGVEADHGVGDDSGL